MTRPQSHCNDCMSPAVAGGQFCERHLLKAKPDPYAEHREREEAGDTACPDGMSMMDRYYRKNKRPRDDLDRIAAHRRSLAAREVAEKPAPASTHPAAWPEDCDSEELRVS